MMPRAPSQGHIGLVLAAIAAASPARPGCDTMSVAATEAATTPEAQPDPDASIHAALAASWDAYKTRFVQEDGRVIDFNDNGVSTSEGQAYGLLRAVWMDDFATFQRILDWTDSNLNANIRADHLHAWKWGPRDDGSWGVYDRTSATDADEWIALALIEADKRWPEADYHARIASLLDDIWTRQSLEVAGRRYLLGGDWPKTAGPIRINPSYYLPSAYRLFSRTDPAHPWMTLVDTSYEVFAACRSRTGLPTNWCLLDPHTGRLTISTDLLDRSSDFGYDAFRVLWNLAADYVEHGDPRSLEALESMDWLRRYWVLRKEIPATITADGIPLVSHEYIGMYGAWLPALALVDPVEAQRVYKAKLLTQYHNGLWGNPNDYYAQNWTWFGIHLYRQFLRTVRPPGDQSMPD